LPRLTYDPWSMPRPVSPLPNSAAVLIIGGGVIGTSAVCPQPRLRRRGIRAQRRASERVRARFSDAYGQRSSGALPRL